MNYIRSCRIITYLNGLLYHQNSLDGLQAVSMSRLQKAVHFLGKAVLLAAGGAIGHMAQSYRGAGMAAGIGSIGLLLSGYHFLTANKALQTANSALQNSLKEQKQETNSALANIELVYLQNWIEKGTGVEKPEALSKKKELLLEISNDMFKRGMKLAPFWNLALIDVCSRCCSRQEEIRQAVPFINRLHDTEDGKNDPFQMRLRLERVLEFAKDHKRFKEIMLDKMTAGNADCHDNTILLFHEIEMLMRYFRLEKQAVGSDAEKGQQIANFLIRMQRYYELQQIVSDQFPHGALEIGQNGIPHSIDQVEKLLFCLIRLKDSLHLPSHVSSMLFNILGEISSDKLREIREKILSKGGLELLSESEYWQQRLRATPNNEEKFQKLEEDSVSALTAILENPYLSDDEKKIQSAEVSAERRNKMAALAKELTSSMNLQLPGANIAPQKSKFRFFLSKFAKWFS